MKFTTLLGLGLVAGLVFLTLVSRAAVETYPPTAVTTEIAATADAHLDSVNASTNFGTSDLQLRQIAAAQNAEPVVRWDLSSIPAGDAIIATYVTLTYVGAKAITCDSLSYIGAYRVLNDWNETQATWNNRKTGTAWNTAGAKKGRLNWSNQGGVDTTATAPAFDIASQPVVVFTAETAIAFGDQFKVPLPADVVRKWRSGYWENNGLLFRWAIGASPGGLLLLGSREYATAPERPTLTVVHVPPGSAGGSAPALGFETRLGVRPLLQ
jgi:hypothetical protein